jgi:N-acetylglutamate synthase-like GNAT family acetyltransferase
MFQLDKASITPLITVGTCVFEAMEPARFPLVDRFYSGCKYKVKCGRQDRVYCLSHEGHLVAAARLISHSSGELLLRNLCVAPELRRRGLAAHFMRCLLAAIAPLECYCFALPHLRDFYLALGFKLLTPDQVPTETAVLARRYSERKRDWLLMGCVTGG